MTASLDVIRDFYAKLSIGDAPGALGLMAHDIEWLTMWRYQVEGRGPQAVADGLLKPLMAEWSSFALQPSEYVAGEDTASGQDTIVSLGRFTGVHGASGKSVDAGYAHIWTVRDGRIQRFRQVIDTLAVAEALT